LINTRLITGAESGVMMSARTPAVVVSSMFTGKNPARLGGQPPSAKRQCEPADPPAIPANPPSAD